MKEEKQPISKGKLYVGLGCGGLAAIFVFVSFFTIALAMFIASIFLLLIGAIAIGMGVSDLKFKLKNYIDKNNNKFSHQAGYLGLACYLVSAILLFVGIWVAALPMAVAGFIVALLGLALTAVCSGFDIYNKTSKTQDNKKEDNGNVRFCKKCGAKLSSSSKFCPKCGYKLK